MNEEHDNDWRFYIRKHVRNAVYSNVWIAFAAGLATFQTTFILEFPSYLLATFVGVSTFFIYNFQRAIKLSKPGGNYIPGRNNWLVRNRKIIIFLTWLGGIGMLTLAFQLPFRDWILMGVPALISIWYVASFSIAGLKIQPLRHIPYLKLYLIGLTWTVSLVALPLVHVFGWEILSEQRSILMLLECFAFIVAITIPFDIRDHLLDPEAFQTLPQRIGPAGSRRIATIWMVGSMVCSTWLMAEGDYPASYLTGLAISNVAAMALILRSTEQRSELFYTGWIDGTIVLRAVLALGLLCIGNI